MTDYEKECLQKAMRFCAYRDRSLSEVTEKMKGWEMDEALMERLILFLQEEKFLSNERFAINFANGKFRNNAWGKLKIKQALQEKGIENEFIIKALDNIAEDEYYQKVYRLLLTKQKATKAKNTFELRRKIADYLMRKGFDGDLVWDMLKKEIQD